VIGDEIGRGEGSPQFEAFSRGKWVRVQVCEKREEKEVQANTIPGRVVTSNGPEFWKKSDDAAVSRR